MPSFIVSKRFPTRVIRQNDEAWAAVAALKKSADGLQNCAPENFIFSARPHPSRTDRDMPGKGRCLSD